MSYYSLLNALKNPQGLSNVSVPGAEIPVLCHTYSEDKNVLVVGTGALLENSLLTLDVIVEMVKSVFLTAYVNAEFDIMDKTLRTSDLPKFIDNCIGKPYTTILQVGVAKGFHEYRIVIDTRWNGTAFITYAEVFGIIAGDCYDPDYLQSVLNITSLGMEEFQEITNPNKVIH